MTPHSVSVIIVSYNVKQYVNHCIETILRSDFIGEKEIIVVDNNSFDETPQFIRQNFPEIKLIARGNTLKVIGNEDQILFFENKFQSLINHIYQYIINKFIEVILESICIK